MKVSRRRNRTEYCSIEVGMNYLGGEMEYESGSDLILVGTVSTEMAPRRNKSRKQRQFLNG